MDSEQHMQEIEDRLDDLDGMPVSDDQSARSAFAHAMVTVSQINRLSPQARASALPGVGTPIDDVLDRLRNWLDRLVDALTKIVEKLARAVSFSISVGTSLSVSVSFSPFESNLH